MTFSTTLDAIHRDLGASYKFEFSGDPSSHLSDERRKRRNASLAMSLLQTRSLLRATGATNSTMYFLLNTYKTTECADPRDKIFALIGLLKPDDGFRKIFPDYTLSCKDVMHKALAGFRAQDKGHMGIKFMLDCCRMLLAIFVAEEMGDWVMSRILQTEFEYPLHTLRLLDNSIVRLGDIHQIAFGEHEATVRAAETQTS